MVSPSSSRSTSAIASTAERSHASTTAARISSCRRRSGSSSARGSCLEGLSVIVCRPKVRRRPPLPLREAPLELLHLGRAADDERRALVYVAGLDVEYRLPAVARRAAGLL